MWERVHPQMSWTRFCPAEEVAKERRLRSMASLFQNKVLEQY
jgi:hypothetical protein